jgi:hypothetical protein
MLDKPLDKPPAPATCPHIVFRGIFDAATIAALLDYVCRRQADFKPSLVRDRTSGERRIDYGQRDALSLGDFGPFRAPFENFLCEIAGPALSRLKLPELAVEPKSFEIVSYGDGGRFGAHIDTDERLNHVRILSCVYYFARTPRPFHGGELRLYGLPTLTRSQSSDIIDIAPETDTMVVFPSWLRHEVMPVQVPSGLWADGRFSLNCWMHRAAPAA